MSNLCAKLNKAGLSCLVLLGFLTFLLFFLYTFPVSAKTGVVVCDQDTSVLEEDAELNFGSINFLTVFDPGFSLGEARALLSCELDTLPVGANVESAILRLYVSDVEGGMRNIEAFKNMARWSEREATWTRRPITSEFASATFFAGEKAEVFVEADVTNDVRAFMRGEIANYGWVLAGDQKESGGINFASKEIGDVDKMPKLIVQYAHESVRGAIGTGSRSLFSSLRHLLSADSFDAAERQNTRLSVEERGNGADIEDGEANIAVYSSNEETNEHQNVLVGLVFGIFLLMFYVFWKKTREEKKNMRIGIW